MGTLLKSEVEHNLADDMEEKQQDKTFIEVTDVHKWYRTARGSLHAIGGLSCSIFRGEFVAIVGPSGCGKSTFLKILSGLLPYDQGEIKIADVQVSGPVSRDVGMVFQKPVLMPWLRVIDNILFPITLMGLSKTRYRDRAYELLELTKLSGFADRYPFELSGGMQQRVAICRALIHDPELLLMDEPFGALDAMTRDVLNLELLRIWRGKRKTIVFVTHSIQEAVFMADRVFVLSQRPTRLKEAIRIDLPRPRTIEIKGDPKYGKYTVKIYKLLQEEL